MNFLKYTGIVIALAAFNQIFSLTPSISQPGYYGLIALCLGIGLLLSKGITINALMIWLYVAAFASIVLNNIPEFFHAPSRLITFILVTSLVGPLLISDSLNRIKIIAFKILNILIISFATLSFFIYAFKLPVPQIAGFSGFFDHSMVLGPMAAIGLVLAFYSLFRSKTEPISKIRKLAIYLAIVLCFIALLLASSRAAIAGAVTALLFFFYKYYQYHSSKLITSLLVVTMLIVVTFPAWSDYIKGIQQKQAYASISGDMATSRRTLWNNRSIEFMQSPVFGIGFATLTLNKNISSFQKESGVIEPGTSWLTILSMMGILGFIPVLLLFYRNLRFLIQDKIRPLESAAMGGLLFFFVTHMFAEGYFLASGSFLFFYCWLLLGILEIYARRREIEII